MFPNGRQWNPPIFYGQTNLPRHDEHSIKPNRKEKVTRRNTCRTRCYRRQRLQVQNPKLFVGNRVPTSGIRARYTRRLTPSTRTTQDKNLTESTNESAKTSRIPLFFIDRFSYVRVHKILILSKPRTQQKACTCLPLWTYLFPPPIVDNVSL